MKLRDPNTIRRVTAAASYVARAWYRSLRFAYRPLTQYLVSDRPGLLGDARYVYTFWHEYLFLPTYFYARPDTAALIGQHADGEILSSMSERFGFKTVRGSSSRGGTAALLRMLRDGSSRHFGLSPDGPRGPRRKCHIGAVYLASRTGLPVVPVGFGYAHCWRTRSWDRFALPKPFSRVRCVSSHSIRVPPGLGTKDLEAYQTIVEDVMNHNCRVAERWAETGEFDPLGYVAPADAEVNPAHQKAWPPARWTGDRGQGTGDRGQGSGVRGQGSGVRDDPPEGVAGG